ncbi:hypothetical protein Esi_0045_0006 [Ectocarpus siliculosus]|uniref:Uncharacterized protein n=1 Tax=Ectocarpus siliculosus TaxID=2880 RepID=D7G1E9_ECTSI|nr:hypothetical protein Esi_0045_0006 [Ectocarpus siliculosus]|eukprot:CBJ26757.1 hypothetical protein Esi_0045_0006 [Ectocarpus siliculosus]
MNIAYSFKFALEENAVESTPPTSSGKRRREPSFGGNSSSEGVGDPKARAPTGVPTRVKNSLAFYRGAVSVPTFTEGERQHIESHLTFQRAYDSVDILSNGKPVDGGVDLALAPVVAGAIATMTDLVGVRPDCAHLTTRERGQLHTSHSDKMKFDLRGTVHLGADVLLDGQVDPAGSTGDFILSGGDLPQPLIMPMRSRDAYIATPKVLHDPFFHGISPPDQASLSVVCTWSPGRGAFNPWRSQSHPLAESFPSLCGVKAVDGEEAFKVTTTDRVPPKTIKSRIRQSGDFTDGVSLFRAPPEEQASAYHRLGKMRSPNGGRTGGAKKKPSGIQQKPNSNPRGPGGAGRIEFDYGPYAISLGKHLRAQKNKKTGDIIISENPSEFFEWSVPSVNNGEGTLGTHPFNGHGDNTRASYPCTKDGARIKKAPKLERGNLYLMQKAREWHQNAQG